MLESSPAARTRGTKNASTLARPSGIYLDSSEQPGTEWSFLPVEASSRKWISVGRAMPVTPVLRTPLSCPADSPNITVLERVLSYSGSPLTEYEVAPRFDIETSANFPLALLFLPFSALPESRPFLLIYQRRDAVVPGYFLSSGSPPSFLAFRPRHGRVFRLANFEAGSGFSNESVSPLARSTGTRARTQRYGKFIARTTERIIDFFVAAWPQRIAEKSTLAATKASYIPRFHPPRYRPPLF